MTRAERARLEADLAEAQHRRDELQRRWAEATYASGASDPADVDVALAQVEATIAELEERLAGGVVDLVAPPNDTPAPAEPEYLDTKQAAALLGVSVKGLEGLRARGTGPPFLRVGRHIRYRRADLLPRK